MSQNRLWFLQACRGLATLLIVYVHWIGELLNPNAGAQSLHLEPLQNYTPPSIVPYILDCLNRITTFEFREVYFGLGLFFLISGFVIPLSMVKGSQFEFLVRRIFRIYPVVIVCVLIAFLLITLERWVVGTTLIAPTDFKTLLANILILRDVLGYQFVDASLWTLEVEVHFYVLCFFIGFRAAYKRASVLLLVAALFCAGSYCATFPVFENTHIGRMIGIVSHNAPFITLMLVGTALFNRSFSGWSLRKTCMVGILLLGANKFCLSTGYAYAGEPGLLMYSNHVLAVLFFTALLIACDRLPYIRWLDVLANVSYPLYLLHGVAGYSVFFITVHLTKSTAVGVVVAAAAVSAATWLVHFYVENPGIALGRRVGQLFKPPKVQPA